MARRQHAAHVRAGGNAGEPRGQVRPFLSAVARHMHLTIVASGVEQPGVERRLADRRQRRERRLAVVS